MGLGLDVALACDFIIAAPEAQFAASFVKRGLISDGGGLGESGRELAGSVALVTGGAIGIGRAICVGLAAAGARVVVADRSDPGATVAEVEKEGGEALGVVADVTSEPEVADAVRASGQSFGGVGILVNNAGIFAGLTPGPFEVLEADDWGQPHPAPRDGARRHRRGRALPGRAVLRLHDRADDRRRWRGLPALRLDRQSPSGSRLWSVPDFGYGRWGAGDAGRGGAERRCL
jgi:hypothetical protein